MPVKALNKRVRSWRSLDYALQNGIEQGLEQGLEKGLKQRLEKGLKQGREEGLEQGKRLALKDTIKVLTQLGHSPEQIILLLKLTQEAYKRVVGAESSDP